MAEVKMEDAPKGVRIFYDKGIAAMERANLDYAMDMFEAALELEPRILHIRKLLRAAAVQKHNGASTSSLTALTSSAKGLAALLKINTQKKKAPLAALAATEKLLRNDPFNLKFTLTQCEVALAAELPEIAIQSLEILREQKPSDVNVLEPLADLYQKSERFKEEYDCRNRIVRLKPTDSKALKNLKDAAARNTMDKAGWDKAESYRDVVKAEKPASQLEKDANGLQAETDIDQLIQNSLRKIESEPHNVNYRRALADLYLRAKQFEQAIETLETCQQLQGGADPQIDRALSDVLISKYTVEIAQAKTDGDAALMDKRTAELQAFRLSDAAERVKRYPTDLQFKYDYGMLLFAEKQYTEAIHQFQQAQRNPQRRIQARYYLALCFKEKGQLDIAAEQLEKACEELTVMDQTKKDVVYELGSISKALGDPEKALLFYKEIYSVDIGYRDVSSKIERAYEKKAAT